MMYVKEVWGSILSLIYLSNNFFFVSKIHVQGDFRQKGGDLTQSYDKSPTPTEMSKGQSDNTNNATKRVD